MTATTTPAEPTFAGKTAEQWRSEAADRRRRSAESFDRCDTDGFLTQWAADSMARVYSHCADIAEAGGVIEESALFFDGDPVEGARYVEGRYGWSWVHDDEDGRPVWLSTSKARSPEKRRDYFLGKHSGYTIGLVKYRAALNRRTGEPFPIRREIVEVVTSDARVTESCDNVY